MIYIITGGIDKGKTRKLEALYRQMKQGDGWMSGKIFLNKEIAGYELVRLSTGEKLPLAYKIEYAPLWWDELYRCGPFRFSKNAFTWADSIINEIIAKNIAPVFIDEIGPLELRGQGFCALLQRLLETSKDLYIVVREHCVDEVVRKFYIREYKLIPVESC